MLGVAFLIYHDSLEMHQYISNFLLFIAVLYSMMYICLTITIELLKAFLVAKTVKNLPAVQKTGVISWHWKYPLEKGMATHSSILAWRIPWTEEPGRAYSPWGHKELDTTE